jgi:hypothetical protein
MKEALDAFKQNHNGELPEHFIIYRDGVGDAMRQMVLEQEITQLRKAVIDVYNKASKKPFFTVIFVNKKIH